MTTNCPHCGGGLPAQSDRLIASELRDLEIDYWHDVDHHWGSSAHGFYADDGFFFIGGKRLDGPDAVKKFYGWREARGPRVARHLMSNMRVTVQGPDRATLTGIMTLYAADGEGVRPLVGPSVVTDILSVCVRSGDGPWRYAEHWIRTQFSNGVPTTVPPDPQ